MKCFIISCSIIFLFIQCSAKKKYVYEASIPEDLKVMKGRLDDLERLNLPGTEEEIKATKTNLAVAELLYLDSFIASEQTQKIDESGEKMTDEELLDLKTQIKYDSIKASLERIIEINKQ